MKRAWIEGLSVLLLVAAVSGCRAVPTAEVADASGAIAPVAAPSTPMGLRWLDPDQLTLGLDDLSYASFPGATPTTLKIGHNVNAIQPLLFGNSVSRSSALSYRLVPEGAHFYKAMTLPPGGLLQEDDIFNVHANSFAWFGSRAVAEGYAHSTWGRDQGYKVVEFGVIKTLKLFRLGDYGNIEYLWTSIGADLTWREKNVALIDKEITDPSARQTALDYNALQMQERRLWRDILKLTTGIHADYAEQIDLVRRFGNAITNDYTYHPGEEITKRLGSADPNTFFFVKGTDQTTPYTLEGSDGAWGPAKDQLNRISFVTDIDKLLCEVIAHYTNADGYIAPDMPSLWHQDGRLISEIALFDARDMVTISQIEPTPAKSGSGN